MWFIIANIDSVASPVTSNIRVRSGDPPAPVVARMIVSENSLMGKGLLSNNNINNNLLFGVS